MSVSDLISAIESIPKITDLKVENDTSGLLDIPTWLDESYLESKLRIFYKDNQLKIINFDIRPALGRGENYASIVTRVRAEFIRSTSAKPQTGHYIIKTSFDGDEFARQTMQPYDVFNCEMTMYECILPKLKALLHEIDDDEEIFVETVAVDYEKSVLIFEDLSVRNFVMPNRLEGLDMTMIKIVLRKLAKMHATSAVLNEREGGILERFDRGMFNRHTDNYAPCFVGMLEACSRRVAQWHGWEQYSQKLANLASIYMELCTRIFDKTNGHIHVLAHGDLWTNNVLARYDTATGKPTDVILIDFQYTAWGSPAIDIWYLLNSSLHLDLHVNCQEELIEFYYNIFSDTLDKLNYKANVPSLHKFHLQLEEKAFYAFHTSCCILPIQRNEANEDADFNALMQTNQRAINFKNTIFKNPYVHKVLKELLPYYERKGLLEVDQLK